MAIADQLARVLRSPAFKFGLVLLLILLLTIPLLLVYALIWERDNRARGVRLEVGQLWGPEQRVLGPFLVVPYSVKIEIVQGERRIEQIQERRAVFTPDALEVTGRADSKVLRRSIFDVPVYGARLKLVGRFSAPRLADVAAEVAGVRWRDAMIVMGLSGVSGLKDVSPLRIQGAPDLTFAPSIGIPGSGQTGFHARLQPAAEVLLTGPEGQPRAFDFAADIALNGSVSLSVAPVARETRVALSSDWPHPSFTGAFLPDQRQVATTGFTASWKVPHLARSVPEAWTLNEGGLERLQPHLFGVTFIDPVSFYGLIDRAAKYGIAFVALAFMAVLCLELLSGQRVHAVQYLFAGIAMVLLYVLLLSLSEHIGFARAYLLASCVTGGMLAAYVGAVTQSRRNGLVMLAVFAVIYGLLYMILRLEDYALLAGAILGFIALTIVMFATLRVDWSGAMPPPARDANAT